MAPRFKTKPRAGHLCEDIVAFLGEFFLVEQSNAGIVVDDKNSFHISCFLSAGLLPGGVGWSAFLRTRKI